MVIFTHKPRTEIEKPVEKKEEKVISPFKRMEKKKKIDIEDKEISK